MDSEPPDGGLSNATRLHAFVWRLRAARAAGDDAEVERIRAEALAAGGDPFVILLDEAASGADHTRAAHAAGHTPAPLSMGSRDLGETRICDFCSGLPVVGYYPFTPFTLAALGQEYLSGSKWWVCAYCRDLVDAGHWRALRQWVGPISNNPPVMMMWMGFKQNRTGDFIPLDADPPPPEEGR